MRPAQVDLSIVVPFSDHEDVIGGACRRLAAHLRELGTTFELIAVGEKPGDNSDAVLVLLRTEIPELRVTSANPGLGYCEGAKTARGRALLLIRPESAVATLAPVGRALRRVLLGELDLAAVEGRFCVLHRVRGMEALRGQKHHGFGRLLRRARSRGLAAERYMVGGQPTTRLARLVNGLPIQRLLEVLTPNRTTRPA